MTISLTSNTSGRWGGCSSAVSSHSFKNTGELERKLGVEQNESIETWAWIHLMTPKLTIGCSANGRRRPKSDPAFDARLSKHTCAAFRSGFIQSTLEHETREREREREISQCQTRHPEHSDKLRYSTYSRTNEMLFDPPVVEIAKSLPAPLGPLCPSSCQQCPVR